MDWKGKEEYKQAKRQAFVVDKKVAGYFYYLFHQIYYICLTTNFFSSYIKRAKKVFIEAVVLNAGHMVPMDQPKVALELIDDFIYERI